MIGRIISHYKILEKLGEGGMGVVYEAEDIKLKRTIALKFLSPQALGAGEEKARFIHEAQAAAALNHPNICTIHEIDDTESELFIAMEYVEGRTLKDRIQSGPLNLEEARNITVQIAEGLQAARSRNIVHRDIKPANIMITGEGRVKIMDFGLAKSPERTQITRAGTTVGTVAYMSPEQTRGGTADHRSDIWSLGVVLYEMIAGSLPFKGGHEQALMYSILNEDPQPLTGLRSDVPMDFEKIVGKCLEKEPSWRYQHVDDLIVDLNKAAASLATHPNEIATERKTAPRKKNVTARILGTTLIVALLIIILMVAYTRFFGHAEKEPESPMQKVAVLFFENLGSSEDEYFANGITDAITARLAGIHGLGIISRQSTIQYKDSDKSIREIGGELGADYILEGTIQRERPGDPTSRIRIIPQLIRVSDDIHLWADTYDEDMTEVFRVQSDIAERVARALDVTLLESEREALVVAPTENLEAYEYYLRGNEHFSRRYNDEITMMAVRMYERATELDPEFTAAWAKLAQAHVWAFYSQYGATPEWRTAAKGALDKAYELDQNSPDVQMAFGYYYYYGCHEFNRALEYFEKGRTSRPNDIEILNGIAFLKRRLGRWGEAAALLEKAADLNPRYFASVVELGITYLTMRRYDRAERLLERALFLAPEDQNTRIYKTLLYLLSDGDKEKAGESLMEGSEVLKPAQLGFEEEGYALTRVLPEKYAELVNEVPPEEYGVQDTTLFHLGLAEMYHQLGLEERAREYWKKVQARLKPARNPILLYDVDLCRGLAYAGLGRNKEALRLARESIAKDPLSVDAFLGTFHLELAALIFVRTGAYEEAIDQLEVLLSVPSKTSRALFRLDPAWDPLRDHPRFRKLVEGEP